MIDSPYLVKPGKKVNLSKLPADDRGPFREKDDAAEPTQRNVKRLGELQEVLYAQAKHAILVVMQGMDTAGKDGAIKHVFDAVNPQGCQVTSFKVPSSLELSHDYLWRTHNAVPPRGMIGIFNRSHYESVIVERVKSLVPESVWSKRYDHINEFERMLTDEGVTILKFFLHISKDEQAQRLRARLSEPTKHWKFNPGDLIERKSWDAYQSAYEAALERCSTGHAPWYVVPANRKWFRNWVLSETIVKAMESLKMKFPKPVEGIEKIRVI